MPRLASVLHTEGTTPSSAASGLISFGMVEDEIASMVSDSEELVCSGEEPEAPSPSLSVWPSVAAELIRVLTRAMEELGLAWKGRPWKSPPLASSMSGSFISHPLTSGQLLLCLQQAHQDMASPLLSMCKAFHCSYSPHLMMPLKRRGTPSSQAGSSLHTMSVLQVFQAKLLQDMDKSGLDSNAFTELRTAMYLTLCATKAITQAISKAIANRIVLKCHQRLNLMEIRDTENSLFAQGTVQACHGQVHGAFY